MLFGLGNRKLGPGDRSAELLGASQSAAPAARRNGLLGQPLPMPGVISGFGGGTWNMDGSPATPDQTGAMNPLPGSGSAPVLASRESQPNHWSIEGFDRMRSEMPPLANLPDNLPRRDAGPLGDSMRQPFDYDAALKTLQGEQWKPKWWQIGLATVADALAAQNGRGPIASQALAARRDASRERLQAAQEQILKWQHGDYAAMRDADLRASAPFSSGRDRVQYDPATGQSQVIYDGPEDFETYAGTLGLEPGSDEYFQAVEDYVLKGNGPSAHSRDLELDDHRTSNDRGLEAYRQGNRVSMERMRQGNRRGMVDYRNANPAPARPRLGSPRENIVTVKTPAEARKLPSGTKFRTPDGKIKVVP